MLVEAPCPKCKTPFSFDSAYVGTKRSCGTCSTIFVLERVAPKLVLPPTPEDLAPIAVETTCLRCRTAFSVDAAFVGMLRTCPSCDFVALIEISAETRAKLEARKHKLFSAKPRELAGCPQCLQTSPTQRLVGMRFFKCPRCQTQTAFDEAVTFATNITRIETLTREGLLSGLRQRDIAVRAGTEHTALVQRLFERLHQTVGTLRASARLRGESPQPPPICDRCLKSNVELTALEQVWSRPYDDTLRIEHVFLCEDCQVTPTAPEAQLTLRFSTRL